MYTKMIEVFQGDSLEIQGTVSDSSGNAVDLTAFTLRMTVKRYEEDETPTISKSSDVSGEIDKALSPTNAFTGKITPSDTSEMSGAYVYDIEASQGALTKKTLAHGIFYVKMGVTE